MAQAQQKMSPGSGAPKLLHYYVDVDLGNLKVTCTGGAQMSVRRSHVSTCLCHNAIECLAFHAFSQWVDHAVTRKIPRPVGQTKPVSSESGPTRRED